MGANPRGLRGRCPTNGKTPDSTAGRILRWVSLGRMHAHEVPDGAASDGAVRDAREFRTPGKTQT
eukprot:scaffold2859_cov349-Pavlova_lutheri.AAC.14